MRGRGFKAAVALGLGNQLLASELEMRRRAAEEALGLSRLAVREVVVADVRFEHVPREVYLDSLRRRAVAENALPQFCLTLAGSLLSPGLFAAAGLFETYAVLALHGLPPGLPEPPLSALTLKSALFLPLAARRALAPR